MQGRKRRQRVSNRRSVTPRKPGGGSRNPEENRKSTTKSRSPWTENPGTPGENRMSTTTSQSPLKAIYLRIYVSMYVCIYLSTYLPTHLSIYPSIHLSIYPSTHLSIYLSIYPSIHLSIYLVLSYLLKNPWELGKTGRQQQRVPLDATLKKPPR